jgi:signal peptidase II
MKQKGPLILAFGVLILDQVSKLLVQMHIPLWSRISCVPDFFSLVHVLNRGAAFGILNTPGNGWQIYFFIGTSIVAILGILVVLLITSRTNIYFLFGLGAILGGALGNLVDRLRIGMVIDFLDFSFHQWHWPAFNLADTAISCGAVSLIVSLYTREKHASDTCEHRSNHYL